MGGFTEHSIGSYYYLQDPSGRVKIQQIGFWLEIWSKLIAERPFLYMGGPNNK